MKMILKLQSRQRGAPGCYFLCENAVKRRQPGFAVPPTVKSRAAEGRRTSTHVKEIHLSLYSARSQFLSNEVLILLLVELKQCEI